MLFHFKWSDCAKTHVLLRAHKELARPQVATELNQVMGELFSDVQASLDLLTSRRHGRSDTQLVLDRVIPQMDRITELYGQFVDRERESSSVDFWAMSKV